MGMRRPEIAGELVRCVVTNENAGRHVKHTVFGVKCLNCGPSAILIAFAENFSKIAVEQRLDDTHICSHGRRQQFVGVARADAIARLAACYAEVGVSIEISSAVFCCRLSTGGPARMNLLRATFGLVNVGG